MANLDALVEVSKIARLVAGNFAYRRFVSNITLALLLAVITGLLFSVLLVSSGYATYLLLLRHGMNADDALLVIGGAIAIATLVSAVATWRVIRRLRECFAPIPAIPGVKRIAEAFMDGFAESSHK